ncbi:hypothetical protein [Richelia sinica]|nr:hypothetical protein [Richelia sinica]MBD2664981.1 hypothetical protein [Richelia sinica FACHB-800]
MSNFKPKQFLWLIIMVASVGYFRVMADLEINYFYKSLVLMIPIQLAATIFMTKVRIKGEN